MFDLYTYALQEALASFRRTRTMSLVSIGVIGVSLFILGIFLLLSLNVGHIVEEIKDRVEIVAYLEEEVSESERLNMLGEIRSIEDVLKVEFISKEEALKNFKRDFSERENLVKSIPYNPFPASFQIGLEDFRSEQQVEGVAQKIADIKGVEDVVFGKKFLARLDSIFQNLKKISLVLGILIAFASIFVISNTIKLTVFARRDAVEIMRLVGATNWFIRLPFLIEGMLYGSLGAILALSFVYLAYYWAKFKLVSLFFLSPEYQLILVAFGILLGAVGSLVSLQKFLKV